MRNKDSFNIAYQDKGLDKRATEESAAIVKDTYRALKKRNKFFNFQLSFKPLQGHVLDSFIHERRSETDFAAKNLSSTPVIKFCGLTYKLRKGVGRNIAVEVPIIRRLAIIRSMLYDNIGTFNSHSPRMLTKEDVLSAFAEDYYEKHNKGKKKLPNELTVSWYIAIGLTCIFYALMIWALYQASPILAKSLLLLHIPVLFVYMIYTCFNKF